MRIKKDGARGGFTLVEVIVVLVILAVLAAIMIPSMTGWIDRAKERSVIVECRSAVLAAQTLASESYGASTLAAGGAQGFGVQLLAAQSPAVPTETSGVTPAKIKALAGVPGEISGVEIDGANAEVLHLTYTRAPYAVTYCRYPGTCDKGHAETYTVGEGGQPAPASWETGKAYNVGDRMTASGIIFECTRAHTSGTDKATRNPTAGSNKSTWKIVGYVGETQSYSSMYSYAEGVLVKTSSGGTFKRTSYNPSSSPTPFEGSPYWDKV